MQTICTPTSEESCQALCQQSADGEDLIACQEVCLNYNCQEVTTYHGGDCSIAANCGELVVDRSITYIDPEDVNRNSCESFGECNQFGCAESACGIYGCPPSPIYYEVNTVCEEEFYCDTLDCSTYPNDINEPNLRCFQANTTSGNPLILNVTETTTNALTNSYFRCTPVDSIEEGDPWCEYYLDGANQLNYNELREYCRYGYQVCDYSLVIGTVVQDQTQNGCDISPSNTDGGTSYNSQCIVNISGVPSELQGEVYDQACCYAYSVNGVDIYDDALSSGNTLNGIRIY